MSDIKHSNILESWFQLATCSLKINIQNSIGMDVFPRLLGRQLGLMMVDYNEYFRARYEMLNEIPSETAESERRFLYNFFKFVWNGEQDVIEIGPLLGGTTRPIAMGMLDNPNYAGGKLYTYDRFLGHRVGQELLDFMKPLFDRGILKDESREHIKGLTNWKEVFEMIHNQYDYSSVIVVNNGALPIQTTDEFDNIFKINPTASFGVVFIDGCKSWYSTKYFMREIANNVPEGAYFIFQDYGTFTCFWLPMFVGLFIEHYELVSSVHHTYTFRLTQQITPEQIDTCYPDTPFELGRTHLDTVFAELIKGAATLNDSYLMLNLQLQHAGAIAYLGNREEARDRIVELFKRPEYVNYRSWILASLNTPTYDPGGTIRL